MPALKIAPMAWQLVNETLMNAKRLKTDIFFIMTLFIKDLDTRTVPQGNERSFAFLNDEIDNFFPHSNHFYKKVILQLNPCRSMDF